VWLGAIVMLGSAFLSVVAAGRPQALARDLIG